MRFKTLIVVASAIFVISSCKDKTEYFTALQAPQKTHADLFQLVKSASSMEIKIPKNAKSRYDFLHILKDSLLFCRSFDKPTDIDVYDIKKQKFVKKISLKFDKKPIRVGKFGSFAVGNDQSLLFAYQGVFYHFAPDGRLKEVIDCSNVKYADAKGPQSVPLSAIPYGMYYGSEALMIDSSKVIVSFPPPEPFYVYGADFYCTGIIDLKAKRCLKYLARPLDNVYALAKNSAYSADLSLPYKVIKGDTLIVSFPMDHCIYGYDINSGKQLFKKVACSKYIPSFPSPLPRRQYNDRKQKWDFRISAPFYEPLNYHAALNMYTRVVHFPQPVKSKDGTLNNGEQRKSAVIILDGGFNIVGETVFENSYMGVYKSFPTEDGIVFGSQKEDANSLNVLNYNHYYKIKKI